MGNDRLRLEASITTDLTIVQSEDGDRLVDYQLPIFLRSLLDLE